MRRIRPTSVKGLAVLGIFCCLIVFTGLFLPYPVSQTPYTFIDLKIVDQNPTPFEGQNVSSTATVVAVVDHGSYYLAATSEGVLLSFPLSLGHPSGGDRIFLRGISWIDTNNSVLVHEFYVLDYSSSIIRSIPGIILFIGMFFIIFTIDFKRLAFVPRRRSDA